MGAPASDILLVVDVYEGMDQQDTCDEVKNQGKAVSCIFEQKLLVVSE